MAKDEKVTQDEMDNLQQNLQENEETVENIAASLDTKSSDEQTAPDTAPAQEEQTSQSETSSEEEVAVSKTKKTTAKKAATAKTETAPTQEATTDSSENNDDQNDNVNPLYAQFDSVAESYKELMNQVILRAPQLQRGMRMHRALTHFTIDYSDEVFYQKYWDFHVEEKDNLMSERFGLRGIDQIEPAVGDRVSIIYTLFRSKVTGSETSISEDTAVSKLHYSVNTEDHAINLLEWLKRQNPVE